MTGDDVATVGGGVGVDATAMLEIEVNTGSGGTYDDVFCLQHGLWRRIHI